MQLSVSRRRGPPKHPTQGAVTKQYLTDRQLRPCPADEITWMCGWYTGEDPLGDDRLRRHKIFARYTEEFGAQLAQLYSERYRLHGRSAANYWLDERHAGFSQTRFDLALDESRIKRVAEEAARAGRAAFARGDSAATEVAASLCTRYRVPPPRCQHTNGVAARLKCSQWWRRNLRREHGMLFEGQARACGLVSGKRGHYASDATVARRIEQRTNARHLLQFLRASNETGAQLPLVEIFRRSESNPAVRRAALSARVAGFELIAKEYGYIALFYTITCPSRMHARLDGPGIPNPRFDGTTPQQSQRYLCRQFQKVRAKWARLGIQPFGLRICEPHRDGTPHWHLLLYVLPQHAPGLTDVLRHYALEVDPDEPGAHQHRMKVTRIDPAKGSAAGYVMKYISKHLDGHGLALDQHGIAIERAIRRVDAWASTWRIRQFQQIGGPSVGPWRELRRLLTAVDDVEIEAARVAADTGDWARYFEVQGGPSVRARDMPIHVLRVWSDTPGRYGEPKGYMTRGVIAGRRTVPTRLHNWEISVDWEALDAACRALVTGWPGSAGAFCPWSSVNNCTRDEREPQQLQVGLTHEAMLAVPTAASWTPRYWRPRRNRSAEAPPTPSATDQT